MPLMMDQAQRNQLALSGYPLKFIQVPSDAQHAMQKVFSLAAEQEEQKAR
jgi:hypothetical protein